MSVETIDDLAFFCVGVGGDGEMRAFNGGMGGFGSRGPREEVSGRVDEGNGGGSEFRLGGDDFNSVAEDDGVGLDRGGHVVVV